LTQDINFASYEFIAYLMLVLAFFTWLMLNIPLKQLPLYSSYVIWLYVIALYAALFIQLPTQNKDQTE
jgi:hypothetical protein